ncbi:hypothetical protein KUV51_07485 [Tateyamaria omphalii]|uniref:DUF6778 family protein n=1 Tax=Tateyamaria omphalii TaxID=299262 RepID=UPI001C99079C|nr:DUF6778 family protein [Tateyamaria omphalii]MBY5932837.1 hypothetical protein [Tateyamaria omphalii]
MKRIKLVVLLMMGGLVSACANTNVASRNVPFEAPVLPAMSFAAVEATPLLAPLTDVRVEGVTIRVPRSLTVSEANRYIPRGDIVWREDPIGDRHAQVAAIFDTAMRRGTDPLDGAVPVALDIKVTRFHALTEKARYTTGGVHNINFELTLRHPETGALLTEPRKVRADLDGFGGQQALQAEARGLTQKVRITNHLAEVIRQELTTVEGYTNAKLGLIQAMNQL